MLGGSLLQRIDRLFAARMALKKQYRAAPVARQGGGGRVCPPSRPAVALNDGAFLDCARDERESDCHGEPLGRVPAGPLWSAARGPGDLTRVIGPGVTLTLCAAGLDGLHAALAGVRKAGGR